MKKIRYIFPVLLLCLFVTVSFGNRDVLDDVATAIRTGNASDVAAFFDTNIDLTILDQEGNYSRAQAQIVLKDFFQKNPVHTFTLVHRGSSGTDAQFGIGTLQSSASLRVYYLLKPHDGKLLIQTLSFEQQ
jgi:hypothetical protein